MTEIVSSMDPQGKRTIFVLTKVDLAERDLINPQRVSYVFLVCVMCRLSGILFELERERERERQSKEKKEVDRKSNIQQSYAAQNKNASSI